MCAQADAPDGARKVPLEHLDITTLRALADAGYLNAADYVQLANQRGGRVDEPKRRTIPHPQAMAQQSPPHLPHLLLNTSRVAAIRDCHDTSRFVYPRAIRPAADEGTKAGSSRHRLACLE